MKSPLTCLTFIIFGPITILIIGFFFLIFKLLKKGKDASWEGKVIDKKYFQKEDDNKIEHFYSLVVETLDGKTIKVGLAKPKWDEFSINDSIKKEKGSFFPKKIS